MKAVDEVELRDKLIHSKSRNFLSSIKLNHPTEAVNDLEELLDLLIQRYDEEH